MKASRDSATLLEDFWDWYECAKQEAKAQNIAYYELDWLTMQLTELDKLSLRLKQISSDRIPKLVARFDELRQAWQQRIVEHVPVQYLAGTTTWRNLELAVTPAVLIPRPETELLIDLVVEQVETALPSIWVDLGTGSGAIAIGLAQALPTSEIHGVDCSEAALKIAQANALKYEFGNRVQFHLGNWFEPLIALQGKIAGMVSNPPYIPTAEIAKLDAHVVNAEPHLALDGGKDGLDAVRHLMATAPQYLMPGGYWFVELMIGQAQAVRSLLLEHGAYQQVQIHCDHAGIERFVSARLVAYPSDV